MMTRGLALAALAATLLACEQRDDATGPGPQYPGSDAASGGSGSGGASGGQSGTGGGQQFPAFDPPSALTIATYNVENLFDLVDDPTHDEGEFTPYTSTWNASRLADRLGRMAQVFSGLDADVVAVNEVENLDILTQLRDAIVDHDGPRYPYLAVTNSRDPRGIKVSVMSRYPILFSTGRPINRSHRCAATEGGGLITLDGSDPEARPIFQVDIDVDEDPQADLTLLANHWKAKGRTSYPCDDEEHRLRSGLQLREVMLKLQADNPDRDIIALGDFNSFEFERPLKEGVQIELDLQAEAEIYDAWGDAGVTAAHTSNSNRWNNIDNSSYQFDGDWTRLDHLLLGRSLVTGQNGWRLERGSVESYHPGYLLSGGRPDSWSSSDGSGYSDHMPVRLRIVRR